MLRQNVIPFLKELFVAFRMAPNIKRHSLYFLSYRRLYKGITVRLGTVSVGAIGFMRIRNKYGRTLVNPNFCSADRSVYSWAGAAGNLEKSTVSTNSKIF